MLANQNIFNWNNQIKMGAPSLVLNQRKKNPKKDKSPKHVEQSELF